MNNFDIRFENPWLLALAIPAVAAILLARVLSGSSGRKGFKRVAPLALRVLEVTLAALLLSGITVITNRADTAIMILADRSDSMTGVLSQTDEQARVIFESAGNGTLAGAMAFAGDSARPMPFTANPAAQLLIPTDGLNTAATDIAAALNAASEAFPENTLRRIVLMSDGLATDGDALNAASALAGKGIRLDALYFDTAITSPEVEVNSIDLPADAALGQRFQAAISVTGNTAAKGKLEIFDGQELIKEEDVTILSGENRYSCRITPTVAGKRVYTARITTPDDTLERNNEAYGCLDVTSGDSILIVDGTGRDGERLRALLAENGFKASLSPCGDMPKTVAAMCEYSLIVLMNVNAKDISASTAEKLEQYVYTYGRSVLTTGGENTYIYGNMKDTAFEEMLPIAMEVEERASAEPVALLLVMDNSASMEGTAIVMAKRGAIKSVESLNPNDYIGVITFSTDYDVLCDMTSVREKSEVISKVSGIGTVMGTMYCAALSQARKLLADFDIAAKKHVILMSDGNPSDEGYESVIRDMRSEGVTTSTIVVGRDISAELMENLANIGGGRFYLVESAYDLPSIMMTDTILLQVDYTVEGEFTPTAGRRVFDAGDISEMPKLYGYVKTTAKSTAEVSLYADDERPLYAQWNYGRGMAGSFTSDLSGVWSRDWFAEKFGEDIIVDMVKGLVPDDHKRSAIETFIESGGTQGTLRVTCPDADDGRSYTADITYPDKTSGDFALVATAADAYERRIPIKGFGKYDITLRSFDRQGNLIDTLQTAAAVSWSREYEAFALNDGARTLEELCQATGGAVMRNAEELLMADIDSLSVEYNPELPITLAIAFCILADIVIRKTRFKRILVG